MTILVIESRLICQSLNSPFLSLAIIMKNLVINITNAEFVLPILADGFVDSNLFLLV